AAVEVAADRGETRSHLGDEAEQGIAHDRLVARLILHEPLAVVVLAELPQELEQLGGELRVSHDGARPWRGLGARAYLQSRMQRTARVSGRSSGMNPSRFGIDTFGSECASITASAGLSPGTSHVRMSMFHAARSASPIGCPNPTPGRAGLNAIGAAHAPTRSAAPTPRSAVATPRRRLRDRILHLPARADRPREDPVVVLDEPRERAALRDLLHRWLHVAGR